MQLEPVLLVGASWLHLLATVIMIGMYVMLAAVFTPVSSVNSGRRRSAN